jgi:hypothetical protein
MNEIYVRKEDLGWFGKYFKKDFISIEEIICEAEDIVGENEELKDKIDTLESQLEESKPISPYDYYGVSEHDFY